MRVWRSRLGSAEWMWAAVLGALCLFTLDSFAAQEGAVQQPDEETRVTVSGVEVEGNTILSDEELGEFCAHYEGKSMSLSDMHQMAAALQGRYRALGYRTTLVIVPPQEMVDGVVRLRVVEGRVGEILIEGNRYFSADHNYLPYLPAEGELLNWDELRSGLDFLSAHPDKAGTVVLRPGAAPGTTDIRLRVQENHPFHFSIGYDNSGVLNTPRSRAYLTLQYDNFFGRGQIGMIQFGTSPGDIDRVRQYAATYYVPLGPLGGPIGHSMTLYGGFSETSTATIFDVFSLFGKGTVVGLQYRLPLPEVFSFREELALGVEYQKISDVIGFGPVSFKNEVRTLPLYARWTASRRHHDGQTTVYAGARYQKDRMLYNFEDSNYHRARADAATDFLVWKLGGQRVQHIAAGWTCSLTTEAQLSNSRLLPSEQYGLGGWDSVRGYRRRVLIADEAVNARAELRTPILPRFLPEGLDEQVQLLAFVDYGWGNNKDVRAGEFDEEELLGAGVGMRMAILDSSLTGRLDVGWALKDLTPTAPNEQGEVEVHIGVEYRF